MEKHGQGTHSTNMGADKLTENTPNAPKLMHLSKLSAQAQKFRISMKNKLHWSSVVRGYVHKDSNLYSN